MSKQTVTCIRKIHFSSGHRVMGHEGKCASPHGHNYYAHIFAESAALDSIGRVIDFSIIKEKMGGWIDRHWDHTFLVYELDTETILALSHMPKSKDPFICTFNPTAENMALYLLHEIAPKLFDGTEIRISKIILYETENCYAIAALE